MADAEQATRKKGDELRAELRDQARRLQDEVDALTEWLGSLATGSLRIRWWSLALLVVGITLATWPTEIASWFGLC